MNRLIKAYDNSEYHGIILCLNITPIQEEPIKEFLDHCSKAKFENETTLCFDAGKLGTVRTVLVKGKPIIFLVYTADNYGEDRHELSYFTEGLKYIDKVIKFKEKEALLCSHKFELDVEPTNFKLIF